MTPTPKTDAAKVSRSNITVKESGLHGFSMEEVVPVAVCEQLEREAEHYRALCLDMLDWIERDDIRKALRVRLEEGVKP
jgi:hypothetical protein